MSASPKVYIVDNNPDHLNLTAEYLGDTGYVIETYASGVDISLRTNGYILDPNNTNRPAGRRGGG